MICLIPKAALKSSSLVLCPSEGFVMDLVTDTVQRCEKWLYPLFYLEFANNLCHWEKKRMYPHPGGQAEPHHLALGCLLEGGDPGSWFCIGTPSWDRVTAALCIFPCAVAGDPSVSLSHLSTYFPVSLKMVNGTLPGTQAGYEG